jgi:hypothetical protein
MLVVAKSGKAVAVAAPAYPMRKVAATDSPARAPAFATAAITRSRVERSLSVGGPVGQSAQ